MSKRFGTWHSLDPPVRVLTGRHDPVWDHEKHASTGLWSLKQSHSSPASTTHDSSRSFHPFGTKMPSQW